jgi:RNase H-like domain found in reverse transcriptase
MRTARSTAVFPRSLGLVLSVSTRGVEGRWAGENQLYAKRSKCAFGRTKVAFLGHVLSEAGVKVDPHKTDVVRAWATPSSTAEVRQFVGLTNYYRSFVQKYAELAAPLTALCSPAQAFESTADAQASFDTLKTRLTTAPVLRTHDPRRRYQVVTDASGLAVSVILTQPDDEDVQHPIAYESRKLTASERKYSPYALEMLAVVHAFKVFRHYLLGTPGGGRPPGVTTDFDLFTDNK